MVEEKVGGQAQATAALKVAAELAQEYVRRAHERRVAPAAGDVAGLARFHEAFPEEPSDAAKVIRMLSEIGGPRDDGEHRWAIFWLCDWRGGAGCRWRRTGWWERGIRTQHFARCRRLAAEMEDVVLPWAAEALGIPAECEGGLVTCATTANFTAMVAARHALLKRAGWNVEEEGAFGAPEIEVVVGEEVHASMLKALTMAGFGKKRLKYVEADGQGRMRADKLPRLSANTIVCMQAGNVNSGSFDPASGNLCAGPGGGRVGTRRWCVWIVGGRFSEVSAFAGGI